MNLRRKRLEKNEERQYGREKWMTIFRVEEDMIPQIQKAQAF